MNVESQNSNEIFMDSFVNFNTVGNLALSLDVFENLEYEEPKIKKLVIEKPRRNIFMGCWQSSNDENGGDGC